MLNWDSIITFVLGALAAALWYYLAAILYSGVNYHI